MFDLIDLESGESLNRVSTYREDEYSYFVELSTYPKSRFKMTKVVSSEDRIAALEEILATLLLEGVEVSEPNA